MGKKYINIPLVTPTNTTKIASQNGARVVNMYAHPEPEDANGKYNAVFYPTPGLTSWSTDQQLKREVRGLHVHDSVLYAVIDSQFRSFDVAGTSTLIGTLNTSSGRVKIASTSGEIAIVDGSNYYVYTIGGAFAAVTSGLYSSSPASVTARDGYFILSFTGSPYFQITDVNDGTTLSALDIEDAEIESDDIVAVYSYADYLHVFGSVSMEPYVNTSDGVSADFPYTRQPDGVINIGCSSVDTIAESSFALLWLGRDKNGQNMVLSKSGSNVQVVSSPAISYQISQISVISDAWAYVYRQEDGEFYVLSFPSGAKTFVLNLSTGLWHEWSTTVDGSAPNAHRSYNHAFCYGKNIVGDRFSGRLFYIDPTAYTDNGDVIYRTIISPPFHLDNNYLTISNFRLDFDAGQGLASGQGSDPQVMLEVSRNGGRTYGNQLVRSAGALGAYNTRLVWERLGQARDFVFKITMTDPIRWALLGCSADVITTKG